MTLGRSSARSVTFAAGATSSRRRNQSNVGGKRPISFSVVRSQKAMCRISAFGHVVKGGAWVRDPLIPVCAPRSRARIWARVCRGFNPLPVSRTHLLHRLHMPFPRDKRPGQRHPPRRGKIDPIKAGRRTFVHRRWLAEYFYTVPVQVIDRGPDIFDVEGDVMTANVAVLRTFLILILDVIFKPFD